MDIDEALDVRDALAQTVYAQLFAWIVTRINHALAPVPGQATSACAILDLHGFEVSLLSNQPRKAKLMGR